MQNVDALLRVVHLTEHFRIPLLLQPVHLIMADQIQVILILRHDKIIQMQQLHKLIQHMVLAELLTVDQQETCIKIVISLNT